MDCTPDMQERIDKELTYLIPSHNPTDPPQVIANMGIINPTATLLSAAMMLRYLNLAEAASRLETAIAEVYLAGSDLTPDQGGDADTETFTDAVIGAL